MSSARERPPARVAPTGVLLVVALFLASSAGAAPAARAQSEEIPRPTTEGLEPAVRALLESTYEGLPGTPESDSELEPSEGAQAWGEAGEIFHAHGALDSALACYRRALVLAPREARWPYLVGALLAGKGELADARSHFEASSELASSPFTTFRIGRIDLDEGRVEDARDRLEPLRDVEGLEASVRAELGEAALLTGDYAAAASNLAEALELQPQALSLHFPLSQAYRGLGEEDRARRHAEKGGPGKVRASDPILESVGERSVSSETFVTIGAQALKTGRTEVASAAYRRAVELNPDNARAWMNLGVLAMESGNGAEAERALRRALDLEPEYGFAHFNLAKLLLRENRPEEALTHAKAAVEANPRNIDFGMGYGDQLMRAAEWQAAAAQYQAVAAEAPDFARPLYLRTLALVAAGELEGASVSAREAWKVDPEDPSIAGAFVRLASAVEPADDVRSEALRVATLRYRDQQSVENGEQLAMAMAANGRFDEAVALQLALIRVLERNQAPDHLAEFLRQNLIRYRQRMLATAPWPPSPGKPTP